MGVGADALFAADKNVRDPWRLPRAGMFAVFLPVAPPPGRQGCRRSSGVVICFRVGVRERGLVAGTLVAVRGALGVAWEQ